MTRVAIIGAGAGGLAASRRLDERDVEHVVYEAGSRVGGLWVYENDNGFAQAYRSLHINSESEATAFEGFPFPPGTDLYPDHSTMAEYFARFAEKFGILPRIRFNSPVAAIDRSDKGWTVTTAAGKRDEFTDVVVASGHQNFPRHPQWRQDFTGRYLHSHAYRTPEAFEEKRVLVVGAGNSALDIAADICTVTSSTTLVARSPVLILPRMVFGWPTSRVLGKLEKPWIPWPVNRWVREKIAWITHGRMERWGFQTPKKRTHPTSHPTLIHHMEWGRVRTKPGITRVVGTTVEFADGTADDFDVIIAGTGYEVMTPFLPDDVVPTRGRELELYRRILLPDWSNLYFLGFFNVSGGANVPVLDHQARWIASAISGSFAAPSPAVQRAEIAEDQIRIGKRYPSSARYGLELDPNIYRRRLDADITRGSHG